MIKKSFIVGHGLRCYVCDGEDNLCTIGLLGEKTECPPETKHCYKSWTGKKKQRDREKQTDERERDKRKIMYKTNNKAVT